MAENVVAHLDDQAELRDLLRELSQELGLCDMLRFKNEKLIANMSAFKEAKSKALADEYYATIDEINECATSNMNEEVALMDEFSAAVTAFNDAFADFLIGQAGLKPATEGGE